MKQNTFKIILKTGSRSSPLAQIQVKEVARLLKKAKLSVSFEHTLYRTLGDQDKKTSLLGGSTDDFFTDALDQAVLNGEIDIAIHSAKDLPKKMRSGLKILCLTKSLDERDSFVGLKPLCDLPSGSRIGTSSLLRKQGILVINPKVQIVDIRGTIEERLKQYHEGKYDGLIIATCALKRLGLQKEITEQMPWEGTPLQGQLAVVGREDRSDLHDIFAKIDVCCRYGKVSLVGAGPGDPDLITMKGVEALRQADVVVYDYLVHPLVLDYAVRAKKIYAGKRKGDASIPQTEISRILKTAAMSGQRVVRLKGGDPLIFGRGGDEIQYLREYHIPVEIIPGVTSATGIPSQLGIPLTARGLSSSVAFISGHREHEQESHDADLKIPDTDTIVLLMGLTKIKSFLATLRKHNRPPTTPIAIISKGTRVEEKVMVSTLDQIESQLLQESIQPPALVIVGETVQFYTANSQRTYLYLGTYPEKYHALGRIIHFPMISIQPAKIQYPQKFASKILAADDILLTSRCGVRYFVEFCKKQKMDFIFLRSKRFITIGADTAKQLNVFGLCASLVSEDETSEGLLAFMKKHLTLKGRKIIFPRSSLSNPYLKEGLTKSGANVEEWVVYDNVKPAKRPLPDEKIDGIIFTSPSTLHHFLKDYGTIPRELKIYAKGTRTQRALREKGFQSEILVKI